MRKPLIVEPGQGRAYDMGRIRAVFKADCEETDGRYSVSEWWLEPNTRGPGAHSHEDEDEVFFVLEGVMSFLAGGTWRDVEKGGYMLVPAGMTHDFENRSAARAGILNFSTPGAFEPNMPAIVEWFGKNPPGDAVGRPGQHEQDGGG